MSEGDDYLIWSYEHQAWRKPGKAGYTRSWLEAGLYSKNEAVQICTEANRCTEYTREVMVLASQLGIFRQ